MANDTTSFSLITGKYTPKIGVLEVDAFITEQHERSSTITDFPVEQGLNISDHILKHPESLTLEVFVSDTPLPIPQNFTRFSTLFDEGGQRIRAFLELRRMWEQGELLDVITGLYDYSDMVIESLSIPRDANTGKALRCSVKLKKIRTVSNVSVKLVNLKPDVAKSAAPTTTANAQPPQEVKTPSQTKTLAHTIGSTVKDTVGSLFGK